MTAADIDQNIIDSTEKCTVACDDLKTAKAAVIEPVNGLTEKIEGDEFDEWAHIGDSSFTHGFLVQSLRLNDSEFGHKHAHRPIKKVTSFDISNGKGFVSVVYKVTVHFGDSTDANEDVYTTILKVPEIESFIRTFETDCQMTPDEHLINKLLNSHRYECDFYQDISKWTSVPVPRVHLTLPWIHGQKEGAIHMEDMCVTSRTSVMFDPFSVSQVLDIARHLAKFHKDTLTRKDWHGKYPENQFFFVDIAKMLPDCMETFNKAYENDAPFTKLIEKYSKFCVNVGYMEYAFTQSWKDLDIDPVFVHGDMWGGNVMWLTDEYGQLSSKVGAFVDWQIMHEGSIMADLARVITLCTDADVRIILEEEMFDFYFKELTGHFASAGLKCPVYLDQVRKAYQYMFLTQVMLLPMMVSVIYKMNKEGADSGLMKARGDKMLLRTKHAFEDMDRLAQGELKWVFDKYNH